MTTRRDLTTTDVFNYVRGAIRGWKGQEDFRGHNVLIIGVNKFGQDVISKICFDTEVKLFFKVDKDRGLTNYLNAFTICAEVEPWDGQEVDITIDTLAQKVTIDQTTTRFEEIGEDPYTQGIHDFYC